jgi:phosphatidylglycerol:prolipoprotein diacylglycerol transferase
MTNEARRQHAERVLFDWRGIRIYPYPAFLFLGLTFGIIAGTAVGRAEGMYPLRLYAGLVLLTIPALVGSRLLYVFSHWQFYRQHLSLVWPRQTGGAALYGGLILALACSWPLLQLLGVPIGAFWDAATVTMLVGMVFTKIGCMLNGCCAGRPTTGWFALMLPNTDGVWCRRVPAQLLEGGLAALLLWGCLSWTAPPFAGARFLAALTIYGIARLGLGGTRESVDRVGRINVHNVLSALLALAAIVVFAIIWWLHINPRT